MRAFFVVFNTSLTPRQLAAKRRALAGLLKEDCVELEPLSFRGAWRGWIRDLASKTRAAPLVAVDDAEPLPDRASWLAELTREVMGLGRLGRPQVVYLTRRANAVGADQAMRHPVVRKYVERDDRGRWVEKVAEAVVDLVEELEADAPPPAPPSPATAPDIVGESQCFRDAVVELDQILRSPYGLVTGEAGVGKMFLIRALWRQFAPRAPLVVLPCGSFFKDYYVAGSRRRVGGGREAVDHLTAHLTVAHEGLLVLHHVERLPTALQEELASRLIDSSGTPAQPLRIPVITPADGLVQYDVRILATSSYPPEMLQHMGQLLPGLALKLRKRHVRIPSLARRGPGDLRLICEDMLRRISVRQRLDVVPQLDPDAVRILSQNTWPGNLADLVRVLEAGIRNAGGAVIGPKHLPEGLRGSAASGSLTLDQILAQAEQAAIENALEQNGGSVPLAAAQLGRNPHALYRRMAQLGMLPRRKAHKRRKPRVGPGCKTQSPTL